MADDVVYDFGIRLRELRKQRGMSCATLAKKLGVSKETVYRYENNVQIPGLDRAKQIATILNTSLDYLVGLDNVYTITIPGLSNEQKSILNEFLRVFVNQN